MSSWSNLQRNADAVLRRCTRSAGGSPGIVAMVTGRDGNVYQGCAGVRALGGDPPMTPDTVFAIYSCTKAITGAAAMQLVEEGRLGLDDAARHHAPEIGELQVLEGFDGDGQPRTRPPKRDITVRDLFLHTSGLAYEFFSENELKARAARGIPSVSSNRFDSIRSVLLFDPGERWCYGTSLDWLGKVVEALRGRRLGDVMRERIFEPLGMADTGFTHSDSMLARRASIHFRARDGQLTARPDRGPPKPPEMDMGGHGLHGTALDYMKFIRMMLNDGAGEHGRVLQPQTVAMMSKDGLNGLKCGGWTSSQPALTNDGEFLPGTSKSWAYSFMVNDGDASTGRPAGSLMWAGLANLYYWIDRRNGIGGFFATQILPFVDIAAYPAFVDFESAVYRSLGG